MKNVVVSAAIIINDGKVFATQRGYGDWKDWWEFPGGKIEPGETPQAALMREIREELDTGIFVGPLISTVEYDYPTFHLKMYCYHCSVMSGDLTLLEHESSRWLNTENLRSVQWLPADLIVLNSIEKVLASF